MNPLMPPDNHPEPVVGPGRQASAATWQRIPSIDIIRGAVMVLMAIDHVRVYSGLPAGGPSPGIFFTRWVTHFCAPAFVFLAGTSAFLKGTKLRDPGALARSLLIRGAWLVLLELTVLRLAWTFNLDFRHYLLAGILWVIGWCMILMAALIRLPTAAIGALGITIVGGHNIMDGLAPRLLPALQGSLLAPLWQVLYFGGPVPLGKNGPTLAVLYSIVPWIGVMAVGYAFGVVMLMAPRPRRQVCLAVGLGAIAFFLVLRGFNLYGNPSSWGGPQSRFPPLLSFLNTNKYPASLDFLLMTLGPTIVLIPLLEHAQGAAAHVLTVFGRVPFFYYVLHIPLIHAAAILVSLLRLGEVSPWLMANHPMMPPPPPDGYTWGLGLLYLVTIAVVTALYFPCRWFEGLKRRRHEPWLSFL
jgi:uncharacterized membrane protein